MSEKKVFIETTREGYSPEQCGSTLTVGELIEILSAYDEDLEVYFSNDKGYTFGAIYESGINEMEEYEEKREYDF